MPLYQAQLSHRKCKTWMPTLNADFSCLTIGKERIWFMWRDNCESRWRINRKFYYWIIRCYVLRASNNRSVNNLSFFFENIIIDAATIAGNIIQWPKTSINIKCYLSQLSRIWASVNDLIFTNSVNEKRVKDGGIAAYNYIWIFTGHWQAQRPLI